MHQAIKSPQILRGARRSYLCTLDKYSSSNVEGGLEEKEVSQARDAGLQVCTLGKRILRCETAPLCALSAVMYDAGEF